MATIKYPRVVLLPRTDFDITGRDDVTEDLTAFLNDPKLVPDGKSPFEQTLVLLGYGYQSRLRVEGGPNGRGVVLRDRSNITIVGGELVQQYKKPYAAKADPDENPRGIYQSNGTVTPDGGLAVSIYADARAGDDVELRFSSSEHQIRRVKSVAGRVVTFDTPLAPSVKDVGYVLCPNLKWNIVNEPTKRAVRGEVGKNANGSAYARTRDRSDMLNRSRAIMEQRGTRQVRLLAVGFEGSNHTKNLGVGTGGYDKTVEAQDAIRFLGCTDVEVGHCRMNALWGNGVEFWPADDGTATVGAWFHDGSITNVSRQCISPKHGGNLIFERMLLAGSARSMIDHEPESKKTDPRLESPLQGLHLLECEIGAHGLGMLALHAGTDIAVKRCRGSGIGTSGVARGVKRFIAEDNVNTSSGVSPSVWDFLESEDIIIRRNRGQHARDSGVELKRGTRPVKNYLVEDNDFGLDRKGRPVPQVIDRHQPAPPVPFQDFTVEPWPHVFRDAYVPPATPA